jgi:hypothetical protein
MRIKIYYKTSQLRIVIHAKNYIKTKNYLLFTSNCSNEVSIRLFTFFFHRKIYVLGNFFKYYFRITKKIFQYSEKAYKKYPNYWIDKNSDLDYFRGMFK